MHSRGRLLTLLLAATFALTSCSEPPRPADAVPKSDAATEAQTAAETSPPPTPPPSDSPVTVGALAPDFPKELFPLTDSDEILLSSASSDEQEQITISLNVRTDQKLDAVISAYTDALAAANFTLATSTEDAGLAAQKTFTNSGHSLTLGIHDEGAQRIITIGGTLPQE